MMSTKNPFRTPHVTPNPTGASSSPRPNLPRIQISSDEPFEESLPTPGPPPTPPPGTATNYFPSPAGAPPSSGERILAADTVNDEEPPAYTMSADPRLGESTLEVGPRRPFAASHIQPGQQQQRQQYAPPQAPLPQQRHQQSYAQPQMPGSWSQYPGQGGAPRPSPTPQPSGPPQGSYASLNRSTSHPPPPRHPHSRSSIELTSAHAPSPPISDFAREFYAAGQQYDPDSSTGPSSSSSAGPSSSTSPSTSSYAPPPGPPPVPAKDSGPPRSVPPRPQSSSGRMGASNVADDGRPTKVPTPGHPLLLNGKMLVYPANHECTRCNNTGFKNFDPNNACNKCWDKYARPYAGALAYMPWPSESNPTPTPPESSHGSSFQRPLPKFRAPTNSRSPSSATHSRAVSNPGLPPSASSSYIPPYGPGSRSTPTRGQPRIHVANQWGNPPPGATVVQPGDPRIGGRLCGKCSGSGMTPFLFFDEATCTLCNGVGRVFGA